MTLAHPGKNAAETELASDRLDSGEAFVVKILITASGAPKSGMARFLFRQPFLTGVCLTVMAVFDDPGQACSLVREGILQREFPMGGEAGVPTNVVPHFRGAQPLAVGLFDAAGASVPVDLDVRGEGTFFFAEDDNEGSDTFFQFDVFEVHPAAELQADREYELVILLDRDNTPNETTLLNSSQDVATLRGSLATQDAGVAQVTVDAGDLGDAGASQALDLLEQWIARSGVVESGRLRLERIPFATGDGADQTSPAPPEDMWISLTLNASNEDSACLGQEQICLASVPADGGVLVELEFSDGARETEFVTRDTVFMPSSPDEREIERAELVAIDQAGNRSDSVVLTRDDIPHHRTNSTLFPTCDEPPSDNWSLSNPSSRDGGTRVAPTLPDASDELDSSPPDDGSVGVGSSPTADAASSDRDEAGLPADGKFDAGAGAENASPDAGSSSAPDDREPTRRTTATAEELGGGCSCTMVGEPGREPGTPALPLGFILGAGALGLTRRWRCRPGLGSTVVSRY